MYQGEDIWSTPQPRRSGGHPQPPPSGGGGGEEGCAPPPWTHLNSTEFVYYSRQKHPFLLRATVALKFVIFTLATMENTANKGGEIEAVCFDLEVTNAFKMCSLLFGAPKWIVDRGFIAVFWFFLHKLFESFLFCGFGMPTITIGLAVESSRTTPFEMDKLPCGVDVVMMVQRSLCLMDKLPCGVDVVMMVQRSLCLMEK
jgi:hypothetical protein